MKEKFDFLPDHPAVHGSSEQAGRPVLVHVTTVPATLGFLRGQMRHLELMGFESHVVSSAGPELDSFARTEQVKTHTVGMERMITPFKDFRSVAKLWRLFRRLRPSVVHASTPKGGLLGTIAARLAGVPTVVYQVRGLPFETAGGWQRRLLRTTEILASRLAHGVLADSFSLRDKLLSENIARADKITVLADGSCNGIDGDQFSPDAVDPRASLILKSELGIPQDAPVIGFVGRLVKDKGVVDLAEAWKIVSRENPTAHLVLVGPWEDDRDPVPPDTKRELQSDPKIRVVGTIENVIPYYGIFDILTLPSYREGFPYVPLEAAAMAIPVVSTRVTGCMDAVVDGGTGALVPSGNPVALASALSAYLHDPALRRQHGTAGRTRVLEKFLPRRIWDELFDYYGKLK